MPEPEQHVRLVQCASAVVWSAAAVVLLRRPEIGWSVLCAGAALSHAVAAAAFGWAVQSTAIDPGLGGADVAVWLVSWTLPVEVIALNWMAVTVPDGRLPKGYLRWPAVYSVAAPVLAVVLAWWRNSMRPARTSVTGRVPWPAGCPSRGSFRSC